MSDEQTSPRPMTKTSRCPECGLGEYLGWKRGCRNPWHHRPDDLTSDDEGTSPRPTFTEEDRHRLARLSGATAALLGSDDTAILGRAVSYIEELEARLRLADDMAGAITYWHNDLRYCAPEDTARMVRGWPQLREAADAYEAATTEVSDDE